MALSTKEFNRVLTDKTVDKFYCSFYRLDENRSNLLGRQVISIERPTILFKTFERPFKAINQVDTAQVNVQPIQIQFRDDSASLTVRVLYEQIYRQAGKQAFPDTNEESFQENSPTFDEAKFDINVKCLNANDEVVEEYTMLDCFITGITHSEHAYTSSTGNKITCTINFDNVDYKIVSL